MLKRLLVLVAVLAHPVAAQSPAPASSASPQSVALPHPVVAVRAASAAEILSGRAPERLPTRSVFFRHAFNIRTTRDRFQASTSVVLFAVPEENNLTFTWSFTSPDSASGPVPRALLLIGSTSTEWRFLYSHDLVLLLDDSVRVVLGTMDRRGEVDANGVSEYLSTTITRRQLAAICAARKVEYELFRYAGELSAAHLEAVRDLASRMP